MYSNNSAKEMVVVVMETGDNRFQANNLKYDITAVAETYEDVKNKISTMVKEKVDPEFLPSNIVYRFVKDETVQL